MFKLKHLIMTALLTLMPMQLFAVPVNMAPIIAYLLSDSVPTQQTSEFTDMVKGKTLYTSINNTPDTLESWTFSEDGLSVTWTELEGGSGNDSGTLTYDGMVMTILEDGVTVTGITPIDSLTHFGLVMISEDGDIHQRIYDDEEAARDYFLGVYMLDIESLTIGDTYWTWEEVDSNLNAKEPGETEAIEVGGDNIVSVEGGFASVKYLGTVDYGTFNSDNNTSFTNATTIYKAIYIHNQDIYESWSAVIGSVTNLEDFISTKEALMVEGLMVGKLTCNGSGTLIIVDWSDDNNILNADAGTYSVVDLGDGRRVIRAVPTYDGFDSGDYPAVIEENGGLSHGSFMPQDSGGEFYLFNQAGTEEFIAYFNNNENALKEEISFGYDSLDISVAYGTETAVAGITSLYDNPIYELETRKDWFNTMFSLSQYIVGNTSYFVNETKKGYRTYNIDGTYDGNVSGTIVSGTYAINRGTMTLTRATPAPSTLVFTSTGMTPGPTLYGLGLTFRLSINGQDPIETFNYTPEVLVDFFTDRTIYYVNAAGSTGWRTYNADGSYDGNVGTIGVVEGTYEFIDGSMVLTRTSPNNIPLVFTSPRPTDYGLGATLDLSINGGDLIETYNYLSAEERDAAFNEAITALNYSAEELANNTFYLVNSDSIGKGVVTYDGTAENRHLTLNTFDQANAIPQTVSIAGNVLTFGNGDTVTRYGKNDNYSEVLFHRDPDLDINRRIFSDRASAQAYYDTTLGYTHEEIAGGTVYGVYADGTATTFVVTYAAEGTYTRDITYGSFDNSSPTVENYEIIDGDIVLIDNEPDATITRIDIDMVAGTCEISYDDGSGKTAIRTFFNEVDAQAYLDSL